MDSKLPLITKAKLTLTEECQLNCKYCYETHSTKRMSLDTAKKIIDLILSNAENSSKIPEISFFGGEPLLVYEELMKPCIEYIRGTLKSRCKIGFTTNGLLLDEDKLKYLKSMNVNFMLSIDGCREAHDANRIYHNGSGSFDDLEKNIPDILRYFPRTMARMTLTPANVSYLYDSLIYLKDSGFQDMNVIPNLFVRYGDDWWDTDFDKLRDQMKKISRYIIDTFENDDIPLVFRTLEDMFPRIVLASYSERVGHHRVADCCLPEKRCGIGVRNNVTFDVEGNVFSCQHGSNEPIDSNPLYLGNIDTGILEDRRLALLEMNREELHSKEFDCNDCPLNRICTGGCVPNNYSLVGKFTELPWSYCRWMRELYTSALSIIEHFDKDKNNILFKDYFYGVVKRGVICVC